MSAGRSGVRLLAVAISNSVWEPIMSKPRIRALSRPLSALIFAASMAFGNAAFAADTYVLDKGHTEIRFSWNHLGVSRMSGTILDYDGKLAFEDAAPEKSTLQFV